MCIVATGIVEYSPASAEAQIPAHHACIPNNS